MTYFMKSGNRFNVSTKEAMDLHEQLPAGTYTVKFDKMSGAFYLESIDTFEIKGKIYGDTKHQAARILNTFADRSSSTGVMLTGEKGSGKTLLAKLLAVTAAEQNIPTIVINEPWCGEGFNAFMQMIEQPTVILFDEFEKVYDKDDQEKMLTLLDGVYPSKKLFVLTCNDKWRVDSHMRNRPGRIFYMLDFKGLEQDFIIEYCEDNLKNLKHIENVCRVASIFDQFNFDMLKALIEEMNRYGESPGDAMKMLNAKPEFGGDSNYTVTLQIQGIDINRDDFDSEVWNGNPLTNHIVIEYKSYESNESSTEGEAVTDVINNYEWERARFTQEHLKQIDHKAGKFIFVNNNGDRVMLERVKEKYYNYMNAF